MLNAADDFRLDAASFRTIADLAYQESGLTLVETKSSMIQSRLRHRLRDLGMTEFGAYCDYVQSDQGIRERAHLISALTTNVSHFFREKDHFDVMRESVKKRMSDLRSGCRLRIWSAGCSNGQEAFSIAMTLMDVLPDADQLNIRILGTDIDHKVVEFARAGAFSERLVGGVPKALLKQHFSALRTGNSDAVFQVSNQIQSMITFNHLNLLAPWPMAGPFDIIFCRNVVIYFDQDTQNKLWPEFHKKLAPGGLLFLGHSERIADADRFGFEGIGPTTYRPTLG